MKMYELEEFANEYLIDGCNIRDLNIEKARTYFCIAWGFNRQIERLDHMILCERLLKSTGISEEETRVYMNSGYKASIFAIDLENMILKALAKVRLSKI